jgi:2-(1,2-epoxy-1,2-dihydrophenyl)acetyl-CoA isomerase
MYFMAEMVDAPRALELGLVSKVVAHDALMTETLALARRLADGPTQAFARMKENFAYGATNSLGDTLTKEAENMTFCGTTTDHREAAKAFVEKREPVFVGR